MAKYRSSQDFAATYAGSKQGIGISIENFVHLQEESTAGTFVVPSIGTQGSSTSGASPSTDISASLNRNGNIAVDGEAVTAFGLSAVTGLDTGAEIAAALETAINTALSTAGLDCRVWADFSGGLYILRSQKTGTTSAVVVTDGTTLDLMTELKIGAGNGGTEAVGTAGGDYLWQTKCSLKVSQPFEMSEHKSGRQATNIIKKKKMAEGEIETYLNVATGGSPSIDTPLSLLLEAVLGKKTTTGSTEIRFDSSQAPSKFFSIVQGNNAFGRYFNGGFPKKLTISLPGDGEAKMNFAIKARDGKYSSIAQLNGAIAGSATAVVNNGESSRFEVGARVMLVDADGRTVVAGQDGSITVSSRTDASHQVVLSTTVTVVDDGFLVPWLPHCFDQDGTDNPVTGLDGTVSFDGGSTTVEEIRSAEFDFDHKTSDFDDFYGADGNRGYVVGDRAEVKVKVEMLLSASQAQKIVQAKEFTTFNMRVVLGPAAGRRVQFNTPKVYFNVPEVEIPDNGPIIMTLEGTAVQSAPGELDAFWLRYL